MGVTSLFGPSGTGKSVLIEELRSLDARFVYISPYMTRPLRRGEKDKEYVSERKLDEMWRKGDLLVINELYGVRYGTPKTDIHNAINSQKFPILDWPVNRKHIFLDSFPESLFSVYVEPPSTEVLARRLIGRNNKRVRFEEAVKELSLFQAGHYDSIIDMKVISEDNRQSDIAKAIYNNYILSLNQ